MVIDSATKRYRFTCARGRRRWPTSTTCSKRPTATAISGRFACTTAELAGSPATVTNLPIGRDIAIGEY